MTSGYDVSDMKKFAQRVMRLMGDNVDDSVKEAEVVN
jgi:hypothetical protein